MFEQFHIFELQMLNNHKMLKDILHYILVLIIVYMEYFGLLNEVQIYLLN